MVANRYKQMIPAPIRNASPSAITHPFANQDDAVRKTMATMARIRRVAKHMKFDAANQEVVRKGLRDLLTSGGPGVPVFVCDVLHGRIGAHAAQAARELFWRGINISDENTRVTMSVAAVCLAHGTLDILREVALSGAPSVEGEPAWPATKSLWLDLLCTTSSERSRSDWDGFTAEFEGLVGMAARHHEIWPAHCRAALEAALEVDKDHRGFALLVEEASAAGAFVREFVMRKRLETTAVAHVESAASTAIPRARRASI